MDDTEPADLEYVGIEPSIPPWAEGDMPDVNTYLPSEAYVAGAISAMPFAASFHPAWCLPIARRALDALSEWEPTDG